MKKIFASVFAAVLMSFGVVAVSGVAPASAVTCGTLGYPACLPDFTQIVVNPSGQGATFGVISGSGAPVTTGALKIEWFKVDPDGDVAGVINVPKYTGPVFKNLFTKAGAGEYAGYVTYYPLAGGSFGGTTASFDFVVS